MKATDAQVDAAANAMFEASQVAGRKLTRGDCRVMARLALGAVFQAKSGAVGSPIGPVTPAEDLGPENEPREEF